MQRGITEEILEEIIERFFRKNNLWQNYLKHNLEE